MSEKGDYSAGEAAWFRWILLTLTFVAASTDGQPSISSVSMVETGVRFNIFGAVGSTNQVQSVTDLSQTNWIGLTNIVVTQNPYTFVDTISPPSNARFYRVADPNWPADSPSGMALIPAGVFRMGDTFNEGEYYELPIHTVYVSAFYLDKYEVTMALWNAVMAWSATNGYSYDYPGFGKGTNHPVLNVDWYDMVKWCNARSQMAGLTPAYYTDAAMTQVYSNGQVAPVVKWNAGYRLPTESEWEKAARGGLNGARFPDGDTISENAANYYSDSAMYPYDLGPAEGYNPGFAEGDMPYTSPVGSFAPNGYGLYDMAGNAWEWCWDYAGAYPETFQTDPRGPATDQGSGRVGRGGNWNFYATDCRNSYRYGNSPTYNASNIGFRCALSVP